MSFINEYFRKFQLTNKLNMILDKETASKKLRRMALEIAEKNFDKDHLIFIGIKENGVVIAKKIAAYIKEVFPGNIQLLELSLDKKKPTDISLNETVEFNGKSVVLIDDVANSGKTLLYAMKPLLYQFPAQIETLVLVERTHKKFPIDINYVGMSVSTTLEQNIIVSVKDDEVEMAYISV